MNDRQLARLFVLGALLCAAPLTAQLSVVSQKDGKKIEGFVLSQDDKTVRIETLDGKTLSIIKSNVDVIEETKRWGDPAIDEEFLKLAADDADGLAKLAETAKAKNLKSWSHMVQAALKLDKNNETANKLLGREKVGDKWYSTKKEADLARAKLRDEDMKAKGFVQVGSGDKRGWIKKEHKSGYDKSQKDFMLDDEGVYRPTAEVMSEKGMELSGGKWIPRASPEDKNDCAAFKQEFEVDCYGMSTKHFRIFSTEHKIEKVAEFAALAEKNYKWFLEKMGKPSDTELFPENAKGQLWFVKDKRLFDKVINKWGASRFGMNPDWIAYITRPGGANGTHSGLGLYGLVSVEQLDETGVKASAIHNSSHMLVEWFVRIPGKGAPDWLVEGWSHYAENNFLNIGQQTCVTKASYGAGGGISDKKFTTKDAKDRCKTMIRDAEDDAFENVSKKDLNSLNGDDLAKGYTIVDWLMATRREGFVKFLETMRESGDEKTYQPTALKGAFNWTYAELDAEWRKWAKAKF